MATTSLMTVEQLDKLPTDESVYYELHHGEVVPTTRPKFKHTLVQRRLRKLLEAIFASLGEVEIELAYRALPEYELRAADVGFVTKGRWERIGIDDNLRGAPDITIEVLSPSNTASEINEMATLCLENGCLEFWEVDPKLRQVKASTPDNLTRTYKSRDSIALALAHGQSLPVDSVFLDLPLARAR